MKKHFLILCLLLTACQTHAINTAPAPLIAAPESYSFAAEKSDRVLAAWYDDFSDPLLTGLVRESLDSNFDIKAAVARLEQAQALAAAAGAEGKPVLDAEGRTAREREDGQTARTGQIGLGATWQIDAFNRLKNTAQSRALEAEAAASDVESLKLSLSLAVADAYFRARAERETLALLARQKKLDQQALDLISQRFNEGIGSDLDVLRQKAQVAETTSLIPVSEAALRRAENEVDVLLGKMPDAFDRSVPVDGKKSVLAAPPKIGVPAALVAARPDLRAQQSRLIAADAAIGAAIADRLPRITLDGSYVYNNGILTSGPVAALAASFTQSLLDWGKKKAEVKRTKAVYTERLATFTQSYLNAVADVENALYGENKQKEYLKKLEDRRRILEKTVSTTRLLYEQGLGDYLAVIDVLRQLRQIERDIVRQNLVLIQNRLALFEALGGPL
jgi:NodT family efflux transporter outer membrane factor (OMF) lipoprotein